MGKRNKAVKLTAKKIRYIMRAKIRGESTKRISADMKLSQSSRETSLDALDEKQDAAKH